MKGKAHNKERILYFLLLASVLFHSVEKAETLDSSHEACHSSQYHECHFKVPSVKCHFKKGNGFDNKPVTYLEAPGPARELDATIIKGTNKLLLSWNLPHDSSLLKLKGFLLNITFTHNKTFRMLLRTFRVDTNLTSTSVEGKNISQAQITYDCITLFNSTDYNITLISYPTTDHPIVKSLNLYSPNFMGSVRPEAILSGEWLGVVWSLVRDSQSSITVCFYAAPGKFSFHHYKLFLMTTKQRLSAFQVPIEDRDIEIADAYEMEGKKICKIFNKLQSDEYYIELLPFGPDDCRCKNHVIGSIIGETVCKDSCQKTFIGPIKLRESVITTPPALKISLIWIGCLLAAGICGTVLFLWFCLIRVRRRNKKLLLLVVDVSKSSVKIGKLKVDYGSAYYLICCSNNDRKIVKGLVRHLHQKHSFNVTTLDLSGYPSEKSKAIFDKQFYKTPCNCAIVHWPDRDYCCHDSGLGESFDGVESGIYSFLKKSSISGTCFHFFPEDFDDQKLRIEVYLHKITNTLMDIFPPTKVPHGNPEKQLHNFNDNNENNNHSSSFSLNQSMDTPIDQTFHLTSDSGLDLKT